MGPQHRSLLFIFPFFSTTCKVVAITADTKVVFLLFSFLHAVCCLLKNAKIKMKPDKNVLEELNVQFVPERRT